MKKKILKLIGTEWWMEDQFGNEMARIKGNFVGHTYDMVAPDKTTIARVYLNWVTIRDTYCIEIVKQGFDPLLVLGYAIAMDNVEHEERRSGVHFLRMGLLVVVVGPLGFEPRPSGEIQRSHRHVCFISAAFTLFSF